MSGDALTASRRSALMAGVRTRDTEPELCLRTALWRYGLRGWRCNVKMLPGRPDVVFSRCRLAVFVDGAFWHGHPSKFTPGKSGEFWDLKISRNQARDRRVDQELRDRGWTVLRIWDFEVLADSDRAASLVADCLSRTN